MTTTEPGTPVHQAACTETRTVTFTCVATAFGPPANAITAAEDKIDRRWQALAAQGAVLGPVLKSP